MASELLPRWAQRIRRERELRGWSQADAVRALSAHGGTSVPEHSHVLRRWKSWEVGATTPGDHYQRLIAATFGTTRFALFPAPRDRDTGEAPDVDTMELLGRIRGSDVDAATLDALRIMVDRLCSAYAHTPSAELLAEARHWLAQVGDLRHRRLTLHQHREVLTLAGWLALLVGCVEYDSGDSLRAEATRRVAHSLGVEAENGEVQGWAHEMHAWFALTSGDYRGVVAAARAGADVAGGYGVAAQLAAQEAKAWARIGDRRQVEVALDRGRGILESLPYPDNIAHHFVVDPGKYDFYAMDVYRILGVDDVAESLATAVLSATSAERSPMRVAEARVTLGVAAARAGDLERSVGEGHRALTGGTKRSLPSLRMAAGELAATLQDLYREEPRARAYMDEVGALFTTS